MHSILNASARGTGSRETGESARQSFQTILSWREPLAPRCAQVKVLRADMYKTLLLYDTNIYFGQFPRRTVPLPPG